jgi:hypothetical protein
VLFVIINIGFGREKSPTDMEKPSAMRFAKPRIRITEVSRLAPVDPATTANVVTLPSIPP